MWKKISPAGANLDPASMPVVKTVGGQAEAVILKGRLEAENIPVHLSYDSAGMIYGFTSTNLGKVDIMVPKAFESAARIICGTFDEDGTDGDGAGGGGPDEPGGDRAA